jgi:hypothetical protein
MPALPSAAASTALRAAMPAWNGFAGVPNWPLIPDARLTAMLIARAVAAGSRPISRETPAAVPIAPQVEVECQPMV